MTRCYEYYCMFRCTPDKCVLSETGEKYVAAYIKFMMEKGVQFDRTSTDKSRFKVLQAKYGTEKAVTQGQLVDPRDFNPCLYNVWSFNGRDPRFGTPDYPWGIIAGQIVQNLLYYYTEKGDLVLDPMAGTGTTIDVCQAMDRRWRAYDLKPTRGEIEQNDLILGLPPPHGEAQLVILDPPYFVMKQPVYPSLKAYHEFLRVVVQHAAQGLRANGYMALILMDPVNFPIHYPLLGPAYQFLSDAGLSYEQLIGLPLPTQTFQAYDVVKAREKRELLGINRQMWVFKKPGEGAA